LGRSADVRARPARQAVGTRGGSRRGQAHETNGRDPPLYTQTQSRQAWSDVDDQIIGGDLTAALAYVTPAGGAVVTPVAPIGLRDRDAGTVTFTTSLGFGRKLERIDSNPRVALTYHAREHGFATAPRFVLVQGTASYDPHPDPAVLAGTVRPASTRFMGPPKTGFFWDRWLSAYYADRVLVTVKVKRVVSWPDLACNAEATVVPAEPSRGGDPEPQSPPKGGTEPRIDTARAARRLRRLPHILVGYVGADGYPEIAPARVGSETPSGIAVTGPLPTGGRRAGLLGHRYEPKLIGLETRQYTGWLENGVYAPHTEHGFRAPANKTLLLLGNGLMARRGRKRAAGRAPAGSRN
jgi:pyridoxamine 5'-phosphate oxidase-like protein